MMGIGYLVAIGLASAPYLFHKFSGKMVKEFPLATQFELGISPYLGATIVVAAMGVYRLFWSQRYKASPHLWSSRRSARKRLSARHPGRGPQSQSIRHRTAAGIGLCRRSESASPTDQLIAFGTTRPSTAFYARRTVQFIPSNELDRLRTALGKEGRTMILLPEWVQDALPKEAAHFQPILKRHGYVLLANEPMVTLPQDPSDVPLNSAKTPGH